MIAASLRRGDGFQFGLLMNEYRVQFSAREDIS